MEINTHNAEILLSAANKSHYPQDELPEIALAGRSNVGKSSFINTMLNRKNLARTSGNLVRHNFLTSLTLMIRCVLLTYLDMDMLGFLKRNVKSGGA